MDRRISDFLLLLILLTAAGLVVTVDKPSTVFCSAYPSNCGKKQRSVLLFSIVAAVSTGLPFRKFLSLWKSEVLERTVIGHLTQL